jgi:signal transduction histidine kinase
MEARESQLQLAATQYGCGTWTLEPNTGELHCSPRALALLGLPADALPNYETLLSLFHAHDRQRLASSFAHALSVRDQFELEFALARDETRSRLLRCTGRAHSSALDNDRHALSGILLPAAQGVDGLITLDAQRLAALVLRLEGMLEVERSTLAARLHSEMMPVIKDLRQHVAALESDSTLTCEQRAQLQTARETATTWLDSMRAMIFDLQPPGVAELGFCGALERYARETAAASGLELALSLPAEPLPLADAALEALFRAACAGIDNVAMHAHAHRMGISIKQNRTSVILEISDDGSGIRSANLGRKGAIGLFASSARLGVCDGTLRVRSRPEGGTLMQIRVAIDQSGPLETSAGLSGRFA